MARAASLLTEFLGFCFYLHRRGGVLGCGPEALPSNLKARRYGKPEQSNTATQRDFWAGRGAARRGGAERRAFGAKRNPGTGSTERKRAEPAAKLILRIPGVLCLLQFARRW